MAGAHELSYHHIKVDQYMGTTLLQQKILSDESALMTRNLQMWTN